MAKYELEHDVLNEHIQSVRKEQDLIVRAILYDNGRSMGGLIGAVTGKNGRYEVESVFMDENHEYVDDNPDYEVPVVCHLDYAAFEVDVDYYDLSFDERQQIVELLIAESQRL